MAFGSSSSSEEQLSCGELQLSSLEVGDDGTDKEELLLLLSERMKVEVEALVVLVIVVVVSRNSCSCRSLWKSFLLLTPAGVPVGVSPPSSESPCLQSSLPSTSGKTSAMLHLHLLE